MFKQIKAFMKMHLEDGSWSSAHWLKEVVRMADLLVSKTHCGRSSILNIRTNICTTRFETSNIIIVINKAEHADRGQLQYPWRTKVILSLYWFMYHLITFLHISSYLIRNIITFRMYLALIQNESLNVYICWDKNLNASKVKVILIM